MGEVTASLKDETNKSRFPDHTIQRPGVFDRPFQFIYDTHDVHSSLFCSLTVKISGSLRLVVKAWSFASGRFMGEMGSGGHQGP